MLAGAPVSCQKAAEDLCLQVVDPLADAGWDDELEGQAAACFFHSAVWARVLQATYGHRPCYFRAPAKGRLAGLFPVIEVSSPITGRRGVSLPFTDQCPPLAGEGVNAGRIFQKILEYGRERGWKYFETRGWGEEPGRPASVCFWGHALDLSCGTKCLFDHFTGEVRTAIRKAEKSGVRVQISQSEGALEGYYGLHCRTRRRHGLPPQSLVFFKNIFHHVLSRNRGFIALARHREKLVAGAVFFHFGEKALYKYGASDKNFQQLRANNLVMWEAIQWCAHHGCRELDFGRSSLEDAGLRRFKLGWGTTERRISYSKYDFRTGLFALDQDRAHGWYNQVFRRMPAPLARLAGAFLYKHLS